MTNIRLVTEDLVRYMKAATEPGQPNFLVEDPAWSQEFAPNGWWDADILLGNSRAHS